MAATLAATVSGIVSGSYEDPLDLVTFGASIGIDWSTRYTNGTGANQVNAFYSDERELAATLLTLDLTADLADGFGTTLVLTKIKELIIYNKSTVSGEDLLMNGNFNVSWFPSFVPADEFTIPPGGRFHISNPVDGFVVTNVTQDKLALDSGTDTITYGLIILGTV